MVALSPFIDPSPLRCFRRVNGYRLVHRRSDSLLRAAIRIGSRLTVLGFAPTPREAAAIAAAYLLEMFGPDWPVLYPQAVAAAHLLAHKPTPVAAGRGWAVYYSRKRRAYRLVVWFRRCHLLIAPPESDGWFPTVEAATAYRAEWVRCRRAGNLERRPTKLPPPAG